MQTVQRHRKADQPILAKELEIVPKMQGHRKENQARTTNLRGHHRSTKNGHLMDPDMQVFEELKRVDAKAAALFSSLVSLIAVTVAIIGLGKIPTSAKMLIALSQITFVIAVYPVLLAIAPRMLFGKRQRRSEPFGLTAWSAGTDDDPVHRRTRLATRALQGYRHLFIAIVIMSVGLALLVAGGVATAAGA